MMNRRISAHTVRLFPGDRGGWRGTKGPSVRRFRSSAEVPAKPGTKPQRILLTGATGFLMEGIIPRLLQQHGDHRIWLLLRPQKGPNGRMVPVHDRVCQLQEIWAQALQRDVGEIAERVTGVEGDTTLEKVGIDDSSYEDLTRTITSVHHCAADTSFYVPRRQAYQANIAATEHMIRFARDCSDHGNFHGFFYTSTAFVAGIRQGIVREDELYVGQRFRNIYEQTKMVAEVLVRSGLADIPHVIFRPSMVTGRSDNGRTRFYGTLEPAFPALFYYLDIAPRIPGLSRLDAVPVDLVQQYYAHISGLPMERIQGKTFHFTMGQGQTMFVEDFVKRCIEVFREVAGEKGWPYQFRDVRFLSPEEFAAAILEVRERQMLGKVNQTFRDYALLDNDFDPTNTRTLSEQDGLPSFPRLADYMHKIIRFGLEMDPPFGIKPTMAERLLRKRLPSESA